MERIEARLARADARPPKPGKDGDKGKDGRSIVRPAVENGRLFLYFSDGTFSDLGQIVGRDGQAADPAQLAALDAAIGAVRHQVEDLRTALAQTRKAGDDVTAALRNAHDRIDAMRPFMASDWMITQDGDLAAILVDGKIKKIGRVVGRDGKDGAAGAAGAPGRDGETKVVGPAEWTPAMLAAARPLLVEEIERAIAAKRAAEPAKLTPARAKLPTRKTPPA
jgi:hypothetical protein